MKYGSDHPELAGLFDLCEIDFSALPKFDKPKNDNERLLNYQWEARNGNNAAYIGMYELGKVVALKYINKHAERNKHLANLSAEAKEEKAHNAITYIVERYYKVNDFYIEKSFTSYLYMRVLHELFYKRKVDEIVQFVDIEKLKGIEQWL